MLPVLSGCAAELTLNRVTSALVVCQMPPAAAATKNVLEELGIPSMSVTRPPMLAGPIERHRNASRVTESSGVESWPWAAPAAVSRSVARTGQMRRLFIVMPFRGMVCNTPPAA